MASCDFPPGAAIFARMLTRDAMASRHRLSAVLCLVWLAASILPGREAAVAQAPAPAPQRQGQAFDEQFKNRIDEVRAGHAAFVTIFDGTSMNGWSVSAKPRHSSTSGNKTGALQEVLTSRSVHRAVADPRRVTASIASSGR
jgi:hypothetical protein